MNIHWNLCIVSVLNEYSGNRFVPSSNKKMKTEQQQQHKESLLLKSLLSLHEHVRVRCVRTYVEEEMAWQATLRPVNGCRTATAIQSMEASSNQRAEATDGSRPQETTAVGLHIRHRLCWRTRRNVIQQAKLLEETEDHTKILGALDEFVSPSTHFVEDSFNYFYLKQGEMSVSHYQAAAEQLIDRMIPQYNASKTMKHTDVKQLLLRNLLLVGLRHKDVLKQCQTMKSDACTAEHLLNLARQAEYRDTTALRLTKTVTSNAHTLQDNSESSLHQINQRRQKIDQQNGSSNSRRCRWCGRSRLCRRSECPARDRYCNKCHIKGHFEEVCRQDSTRRINKQRPVHKLEDDDEDEEDEVTSVYSFNTLYNLKAMESEHIRPLWISTTATSQVHKVNVEVDTGADCNVMPVYLFSKIFGSKQPEPSDARIQAYGGMPVTIVGKCTVIIHKSDGTQTSAVFQVTHHNGHAIIGRSTSTDIGYVNLPAIECPPLSMAPITHDVQTLQQHVEQPIMHKTQSSTTIDNIRNKGTNNSVADVLSHASPHPHRSTDERPEDVTPLHVLSDSIPANQSCLDSVQTEAKKDGTLQQPRNCQATQSTRCSQQQEGLSQYEGPAGPWKRLGIDYFKWNQQRYLLIADYYSRFPIIRSVSKMSAAHLVTVLKTIFSEYGLPEELVSDKGTQFTSEQYTSFAEEYNIKITHSSPRYPQSNGFIESMVKITKQILQRCKQTSSDPHMAMLLYRSTPLQSGTAPPAELLSQRRYQTTLPNKNREPVRSRETKANVIGTPTGNNPKSYKIQLPTGQRFTRNRRHLRPDRGTAPDDNEPDQIAAREPRGPRRSARESHPPRRLRYNQLGESSSY